MVKFKKDIAVSLHKIVSSAIDGSLEAISSKELNPENILIKQKKS